MFVSRRVAALCLTARVLRTRWVALRALCFVPGRLRRPWNAPSAAHGCFAQTPTSGQGFPFRFALFFASGLAKASP